MIKMFVCMTVLFMTMAMGVRSGGIIMRMRMVIMSMRTMRMVMGMAVTRLGFSRAREVVDKRDSRHWGLLQTAYAFMPDRPANDEPCRLHLGI